MDESYSVIADVLNKFHTASDAIQALWLIAVAATVLGIAYLFAQVLLCRHGERDGDALAELPLPDKMH